MNAPLLTVRDLRTCFLTDNGPINAVDGVSFEVGRGESVGLVGESGCGKTVTALSILGLTGPTARIQEGSLVEWDGEQLVGAGERRLRAVRGNEISMIFQDPMNSLNPVFPVGEQVAEVLRAHRGMTGQAARAETVRLFDEVGIPGAAERRGEYPHRLSGGMRQRVMIAMALACEPALIIADEPTTALDTTVQAQILELLARTTASRGMSVLLITHDLAVVAEACESVVVMYAGQVVEAGLVAEVFAHPAHPYTRALLESVPSGRPSRERLGGIPGTVPDPAVWPVGCRFRERCAQAREGCERPPQLEVRADGRSKRCWLETATAEGSA